MTDKTLQGPFAWTGEQLRTAVAMTDKTLPEPVAFALHKPDGSIDFELIGTRADCEYWAEPDPQHPQQWHGLPVVGIYTADQLCAVISELDELRDALLEQVEAMLALLNEVLLNETLQPGAYGLGSTLAERIEVIVASAPSVIQFAKRGQT